VNVTTPDDAQPLHPDSVAIRAGRADNGKAMAPIVWASSVWETPTLAEARRVSTVPRSGHFYSRYANPSVTAFEDAVAALEGAESALAFGSGMGAFASVVMALCSPGDHIVAQRQIYSGTQLYLQGVCGRFGIEVTFVDGTEPGAFAAAVRPGRTMLIVAETPANPVLALTDLSELGAIKGPFTLVDSTFATPVLQRPLEHGVDLVLHSATKGIAGHNDATLGVVAGSKDLLDAIWSYSTLHGAAASPYDATNGLRGIRTLPVRIARQSDTALRLAEWLEQHPAVACARHPSLPSHPQHDLAKRQMALGGSMVAVDLAGGLEAGRRFVEGVRLARMASSLGGPETLVSSPANSTHIALTPSELEAAGITPGLVRVSIGLEHPDDLITDFAQALAAL
jgi:cystathionine beta-lyase/cystathionine gamma-synthase